MRCFLAFEDLDSAEMYSSKADAVAAYAEVARYLARFGQGISGCIHYARDRSELCDYPDFILHLGPRDGVVCERT